MKVANIGLSAARSNKKDEFYTQLTDIEKELKYYKSYFKDKIVLCNCDDPKVSNFFKFFILNFKSFELKQLISVCYKNNDPDMFSNNEKEKACYQIYNGEQINSCLPDESKVQIIELNGNGDFRSEEGIKFIKQADIIVTNPPFSLFREFVAMLMKFQKQFLILGNVNAITYKEIFPYFKDNKMWFGVSIHSGDRKFYVPDDYPLNAAGCGVDEEGKRFIRVKGVRWFTNLPHNKRNEDLDLFKTYNKEEYPMYDNYDAINVNKTADIPLDYDGVMGVPITFLDKYNPKQFEILDARDYAKYLKQKNKNTYLVKDNDSSIGGKNTYARILIKKK